MDLVGRVRGVRALIIGALSAGLSGSALAQPPATDLVPLTLRSGPLEVAPSWLTSNGFDTNILRAGVTDPISSYEFFTIPQMDATYTADRFTLTGTGAMELAVTPGEVNARKKSTVNNYAEVNLQWGNTVLRPSLVASRKNTYARPEFDVGRKSQRIQGAVSPALTWSPGGRINLEGGFSYDWTQYEADQVFRGVSLDQDLNRRSYTPRFSSTVRLREALSAGVGIEFTEDQFLKAPERNGYGRRAYGILAFAIPSRLVGSVNIGTRTFRPDSLPDQQFGGGFVRAGLTSEVNRTFIIANVSRDIGFSYDTTRGFFVALTTLLNVRRELPKRLEIEAEASAMNVVYKDLNPQPGLVPDLRRLDALLAVGVRLKPWMKVGGNIEREIASGSEKWDAWRFTFYSVYGTKRIRKLDRPLPK